MNKLFLITMLWSTLAFAAPREVVLTPTNTIVLSGMVTPFVLVETVSALLAADQNAKPGQKIYLLIYTNGGMLDGCEQFNAAIETMKHVEILILRARSAGALISQCGIFHRSIDVDGDLMFHKVRISTDSFLSAKQLSQMAEEVKAESDHFDKICSTRLSISPDEYDKNTDEKDWFVRSAEAVKIGAADEEVKLRCDPEFEKKSPMVLSTEPLVGVESLSICQVIKNLRTQKGKNNGKPKTK